VIGVRPAPNADWFIELVADQGAGAAAGDQSRRLVGQLLGWINNIRFQRDLVTNVVAILDLTDLPSTEGHLTSKLPLKCTGCQTGMPVTRVTNDCDKLPLFKTIKV